MDAGISRKIVYNTKRVKIVREPVFKTSKMKLKTWTIVFSMHSIFKVDMSLKSKLLSPCI